MNNTNIPPDRELPSTSKLITSTILAAVVAAVLLVTVIMPAEYGIDPTGLGEITGLKRMGEIKTSLAKDANKGLSENVDKDRVITKPFTGVVDTLLTPGPTSTVTQDHKITFTLAPDESTEVKVTMLKGSKVDYIWETNGRKAIFDLHGDSQKQNINYHSYRKGSDVKREGILDAAFDGNHGWFWRNRNTEPLIITLKTHGEYTKIKRY